MGAESADQQEVLGQSVFKALSEHAGPPARRDDAALRTLSRTFPSSCCLARHPGALLRAPAEPSGAASGDRRTRQRARALYFEPPSLVDQLVDEVAEMPGALPLLSFTMSELYRAYVRSARSDRLLTKEDYQKLGGVAGSLSQRADEIYRSLDAPHQDTLCRVMLRMVSIQAGEVARRRVPLAELHYGDGQPEEPGKRPS